MTKQFQLKPCRMEADLTLGNALRLAANLRKAAEEDLKEARGKAVRSLKKSRQIARQRLRADKEQLVREIAERAKQEKEHSYKHALRLANGDCLDLALAIAGEVIKETFLANRELLTRRIDAALQMLINDGARRIRVHAEDRPTVFKHFRDSGITVSADNKIMPGCAYIDGPHGSVHLDWEENLIRLGKNLNQQLEVLGHAPPAIA